MTASDVSLICVPLPPIGRLVRQLLTPEMNGCRRLIVGFLFFSLACCSSLYAGEVEAIGNKAATDLEKRLANAEPNERQSLLLLLSEAYEPIDRDRSWHYAQIAQTEAKNSHENLLALAHQAVLYRSGSDYGKALTVAGAALEEAVAQKDLEAEFRLLLVLSDTRGAIGDVEGALKADQRSIEIAEAGDDWLMKARAYFGMGTTLQTSGKRDEAKRYLEQARTLASAIGATQTLAAILNDLGNINENDGQLDEAEALQLQALSLRTAGGNLRGVADSYQNLGNIARKSGNPDLALEYYEKAYPVYEQMGLSRHMANLLRNRSRALRALGRTEEALDSINKGMALAKPLKSPAMLGSFYDELSLAREAAQDYPGALEAARLVNKTYTEMQDEQSRWRFDELQARYDAAQRDNEIERLKQAERIRETMLRESRLRSLILASAIIVGLAASLLVIFSYRARIRVVNRAKAISEEAREAAERTAALRMRLLHIASHDLRNPLTAVLTGLDVIRTFVTDPVRITRIANQLDNACHRMSGLLGDLLDHATLEGGKLQLTSQRINLQHLLQEIAEASQDTVRQKRQSITTVAPHGNCSVRGDPTRLWQVFDNLLSNAIKFSPHGTEIKFILIKDGDRVRCGIRDEGPGISSEEASRLFQPFVRGEARPTGGEHSTGLGLSLVRELVTLHEGKVWIDSVLGSGATFWVELPLSNEIPAAEAMEMAERDF